VAAAAAGVDLLDDLAEATRSWNVVGGRELGSTGGSVAPPDSLTSSLSVSESLPGERKLTSPASCVHFPDQSWEKFETFFRTVSVT